MSTVLVVGGTGPTGYAIVRRLVAEGDKVTILHTGAHEVDFGTGGEDVEHVHTDPTSLAELKSALHGRSFDSAVSTSGRLRHVVTVLSGRIGRLVAVTGLPGYTAWKVPVGDPGQPMPLREDAKPPRPLGDLPGDRLSAGVQRGEALVAEAEARGAFTAAILRYTMVYGPYAYVPFEWYFVRRVLDGRRELALEGDGLMLPQRGYAENLAEAVLLTLTHPGAAGHTFNVGDEHVLSVAAIAATVAEALGHEFDVVPVPLAASPCGNPFALRQHTMFDLGALRALGYRDVVDVREATRRTARWMAEHPIGRGSPEERSLGDHCFDYDREDRVIEVYRKALQEVGG
ncbi:NAD-dependent epimerase/dehydratase family protein [Actinophytocola oryzae]|uniref:Nucleoside-diphosphate-sugar epimerase n=1 Tax=Actinophytocola oryzae TaxID=502181 RepID=A0A4R7W2L8_9PSEU|nr:NAD-dependent epimerase/dehydratase family protein [Actinophytocola oryzae]TDV56375.1 nucleoside-diphosphate-sugar epimerase [Actinophytocola oryzae]